MVGQKCSVRLCTVMRFNSDVEATVNESESRPSRGCTELASINSGITTQTTTINRRPVPASSREIALPVAFGCPKDLISARALLCLAHHQGSKLRWIPKIAASVSASCPLTLVGASPPTAAEDMASTVSKEFRGYGFLR